MENEIESVNAAEDEFAIEGALAHKNPSSSMMVLVLTLADPPEDDRELAQLDEDGGHRKSRRDDHEVKGASANLLMSLNEIERVGVFHHLLDLVDMDAEVGIEMRNVNVPRWYAQSLMVG